MTSQHKNKTAWNDVTGDSIRTGKGSQEAFANGWDRIFGKKQKEEVKAEQPCEACKGEGGWHDAGWWYECPECHPEAYKKEEK